MKLELLDRFGKISFVNYDPLRSDLTDEKGNCLLNSFAYMINKPYKYLEDPLIPIVYLRANNLGRLYESPTDIIFHVEEGLNDEEKMLVTNFILRGLLDKKLLRIPHTIKKLQATLSPFLTQSKSSIDWNESNPIDLAFFIATIFILTGKLVISING